MIACHASRPTATHREFLLTRVVQCAQANARARTVPRAGAPAHLLTPGQAASDSLNPSAIGPPALPWLPKLVTDGSLHSLVTPLLSVVRTR